MTIEISVGLQFGTLAKILRNASLDDSGKESVAGKIRIATTLTEAIWDPATSNLAALDQLLVVADLDTTFVEISGNSPGEEFGFELEPGVPFFLGHGNILPAGIAGAIEPIKLVRVLNQNAATATFEFLLIGS